jgi:peroxiredoxin
MDFIWATTCKDAGFALLPVLSGWQHEAAKHWVIEVMKKTLIIILALLAFWPLAAYPVQLRGNAPQFELTDLTGNIVKSESLQGKVVILVFWATWCDECRKELPELDILYKKYRNDGLEVIAINLDSSPARLTRFLQRTKPSFPVLHDEKGTVAAAYSVSGIPTSFIIDRTGIASRRISGFESESLPLYEREINDLLK